MIRKYLENHNYLLPHKEWYAQLNIFLDWYKGCVKSFHDYKVHTSQRTHTATRYQMGFAKTICEDFASLLINEKMQIVATGFDDLPDILESNDFYQRANRLVELTFALGSGAFVEYLDGEGNPTIDFIRGDLIYPLRWDGDKILDCAFASKKSDGYYLQVHERVEGGYQFRNIWLNEKGEEQTPPNGIEVFSPISPIPLFQIIRPSLVNNIDLNCPMGISVFGNALEQLKALDIVYDSYINEFTLGKKRLLVPQGMQTTLLQENGTIKPLFDPSDTLIYCYQADENSKDSIKELDFSIRAEEHEQALQRCLDLLSKKCGLGTGRYNFENNGTRADKKTATEVISEKSDLFQSLKRHEKNLEQALIGLIKALHWLAGKTNETDVTIQFDDSIFEDSGTIAERNILLVQSGLRSKVHAIMKIDGVNEQTAMERLRKIEQEEAGTFETNLHNHEH